MDDDHHHRGGSRFLGHGCWRPFLTALVTTVVLVAAIGVALPVRATVTDVSVSDLDLIIFPSNGTGTSDAADASSVVLVVYNYNYNLSVTVQLRNRNWAMRAELAAPLDAEIRFAGRRLDGARLLAHRGWSLPPRAAEELHLHLLAVVPSSSPGVVALGGEKVLEVELRITGEVRYHPVHVVGRSSSSRLKATCSLKMIMPNAPPPP